MSDEATQAPEEVPADEGAATEPVEPEAQSSESTDDEEPLGESGKRAIERMKQERNEARRELEKLKRDSMSEQERAIAEAKDAARAEALREVSGNLVDAEIRSAAVNRPVNVDALLGSLDRSKFLDDDGNVDRQAVTAWLDELAPVQSEPRPARDLAQGTRGVNRSDPADVFGQLITNDLK